MGKDSDVLLPVLLFIVFCVPFLIVTVYPAFKAKITGYRRKRQLHPWLLEHQFIEIDKNNSELWSVIKANPMLSGERRRTRVYKAYECRLNNVVLWIIDCSSLITSSSSSGSNYPNRHHVCIVSSPDIQLPEVRVIPTQKLTNRIMRFTEKMYKFVQRTDQNLHIRIVNDPHFSESYLVLGKDEQSIQQIFSTTLCRLLTDLRTMNMFFGCSGQNFIFHYTRYVGPDDAVKMKNQAAIFLKLFQGKEIEAEESIARGEHLSGSSENREL